MLRSVAIAYRCIGLVKKEAPMRGVRRLATVLALVGVMAPAVAQARRDAAESVPSATQTGDGNSAIVRQIGEGNAVAIAQTGERNTACVVQIGDNHSYNLTQNGGETASVMQNRGGHTHNVPLQACRSMHGGRRS
ncbi:MAG: hypothetical protein R3C30_02925 [Hyphomonadaceae bacterium]